MSDVGPVKSTHGLERHGVQSALGTTHWNLPAAALIEEAVKRNEGILAATGPFCAVTTPYTGRSPNDKFVVEEPSSKGKIWWGKVNQPISEARYDALRAKVVERLSSTDRFVRDCHLGADPRYRIPLRVVSERAWHSCSCGTCSSGPRPRARDPRAGLHRAARADGVRRPASDGTNPKRSSS